MHNKIISMSRQEKLNPASFYLPGGSRGILLVHGFTGSPPEMRPIADYLNQRGISVSAPLLPGHGTSVKDMNRCKWTDWANATENALKELRSKCKSVFVGGLSMGSLLALNLGTKFENIPGIILLALQAFVWVT